MEDFQEATHLCIPIFHQLHSKHEPLAAHITNDAVLLLQGMQPLLYVASNL